MSGSFLAAFYVSILIHELGHAAAALVTGFELRGFAVGPVIIHRQAKGAGLKFVFARAFSGGLTAVVPRSGEDLKRRFAWFAAGGPLATLLLLVVSASLRSGLVSGMFVVVNILLGVSAIIPYTVRSQPNDARVIQILTGGGASGDRLAASLYLLSLDSQGIQPKHWPADAVAMLHLAPEDRAYLVSVLGKCYHLACAAEEPGGIAAALEAGLANTNRMPADAKRAFFTSAAAFQGFHRGNAGMAETWMQRAHAVRGTAPLKDWESPGIAAIAQAQGRSNEAAKSLRRYLSLLDSLPRSGMLAAERERTERLIQKLSPESACA